jgi:hypothetical protein
MKTFLLLYITLAFISQVLLFNPLWNMLFTLLSVVCIPIITAYALKWFFSISIRPRPYR